MFGFRILAATLPLLCVFLLNLAGRINGHENGPRVKVTAEVGGDAVLPCSLSTKENIVAKVFDWKRDGQEVFMYDAGIHYNNGRLGQEGRFKGRVSHFADRLKEGNASIVISHAQMADSGNYTCAFPLLQPSQIFHIELVVGAAPEPYIRTLDATEDGMLLQCDVRDASPKPKVKWQGSAGNILSAKEPQFSFRGDRYHVTLLTTITKTDRVRCVVTQEETGHQIHAETYVYISGNWSSKVDVGWVFGGVLALLAVALFVLVATKVITVTFNRGPCQGKHWLYKAPSSTDTSDNSGELNNVL